MNIQLTGSSGFVGKNLSNYFKERSIQVKPLFMRNSDWENSFDADADAIIHLAGKAHDTSNTSEPFEYFSVNRDLTIKLFNLFLNSNIKDFFYFSSVKAVADSVNGVLDEKVIGNPITPYGKSKFEAETYLMNQALPENKRLFIIRPCMIHGPGNKGNLNLLYNVVKKGIPWPLAAFHNQRSFLGIDNLSFLIGKMLTSDLTSGVYNFCDDKTMSTNELVKLIAEYSNKKEKLLHIPVGIIRVAVKIGDFLPLPINSERLQKLTESYVVSNRKIKDALGLSKLPNSTEEGLIKTLTSFKGDSFI